MTRPAAAARRHRRRLVLTLVALLCCVASWMAAAPAAAQGAAGAPQRGAGEEYRLGAGDVIRVLVFQSPELTLETRVSESGLVSYPLLGSVRIGGQTVAAAEKTIADGLRAGNFLKQPQVTIVVLQVRGHQASVLGQVNRPGRYPLELADMRLTDLLALAGGTAPAGADLVVVSGTRDGRPFRAEIDLPALFGPASQAQDIRIVNGDVIWIDRQPLVYIYGEVQRPGAMRLERDMTLMQVLAAGGGLTQRGTEKGIRVHRKDGRGQTQVLEPKMADRLQDGDVVFVRESLF